MIDWSESERCQYFKIYFNYFYEEGNVKFSVNFKSLKQVQFNGRYCYKNLTDSRNSEI